MWYWLCWVWYLLLKYFMNRAFKYAKNFYFATGQKNGKILHLVTSLIKVKLKVLLTACSVTRFGKFLSVISYLAKCWAYFGKFVTLLGKFCLRTKAKDLGITQVVVVLVGFFISKTHTPSLTPCIFIIFSIFLFFILFNVFYHHIYLSFYYICLPT